MSETATAIPVSEIVQRYVALRDKKDELNAAHKKKIADLDAAMEKCENFLLATMNQLGADSLKTEFGTAYTTTKTSATVGDWDAALNWIKENQHWGMLDRRVNKTFVQAYRDEHNDLPPGVNWSAEKAVNIRRS